MGAHYMSELVKTAVSSDKNYEAEIFTFPMHLTSRCAVAGTRNRASAQVAPANAFSPCLSWILIFESLLYLQKLPISRTWKSAPQNANLGGYKYIMSTALE